MSSAPVRGIVPHRQRRHHHHHHEKHQRRHNSIHNNNDAEKVSVQQSIQNIVKNNDYSKKDENQEKRPKVNPIFLWAAQREQRIVEVRCEDYDKRNRIKLTKTAQGWRSIPRTALTAYPIMGSITEGVNEQQKALATISKNEEKENTAREQLEIKPVKVDELEDTRINNGSKVDETQEERERHKRKRKKHSELSKNKKRRIDSEIEKTSETLITINWKMKKRRKLDKSKKRKKLCLEETGVKTKVDNQSEIKIKEESKKEVESIDEVKKTEDINVIEDKEQKKCINKFEKVTTLVDDHKKCNDLEKLQKNRHLQPRVVLEQLHLSQLPSRIHRRLVNRAELENNAEQSEGNKVDEIVQDNVENSNQNNHESRIDSENEEAILDKEDWLQMLNMLDSNHVPINVNENKSSLIENKNLTKICTNLSTSIISSNETNDTKLNLSSKENTKKEHELTVTDKRTKFGQRDIKHRVGSKSLDETIERLERSINNQKKINSVPNILAIAEYGVNKQKNKIKNTINDKVSNVQNTISLCEPIPASAEDTFEKVSKEKDIIESSKILNALRNTPGLSVSLATNGKKHDDFINTISNTRKILPSSRSPDSQTEVAERTEKSLPGISNAIPAYQHRSKTASPISKNRVESPESTVNFPKNERCGCEADTCETEEDQDCDSQVVDEIRNQPNSKKNNIKCAYQNHENFQNYFDDDGKTYSMDLTKVPNLKPLIQLVSRNSEAQAKYSDLSGYQEIDNFDEQIIEEFHSQVSPQPSGIPYSIPSSRRCSSAYLERLLPSPPCSVTCSEDAKNDLTLKGILSSPNNIDTKNQDKKEQITDLNSYCDSELSPSYNIPEETFIKESPVMNKIISNPKSHLYSQEKIKYLEMRNHRRPMSNGDVQNPLIRDYVSPKRPLSAEWSVNQQRIENSSAYFLNNIRYMNQEEFISRSKLQEMYARPTIFLDPASQLRELIKTSGHLIPDPLLVPRDYLPFLAGAPLTEIPKLLTTRPELRLPEALTRPELLRDPDLLVISLAHLQYVLDHGEGPVGKSHQSNQMLLSSINVNKSVEQVQEEKHEQQRPKLICKPIDKLMPAPMDLSNNQKVNSNPPLLRVRSGLLKQEPEVSSTANSLDDSQLWHPLFGSQKQRQRQQQQQPQPEEPHQQQQQPVSWHRTTLAS